MSKVIIVDRKDRVIGSEEKSEAIENHHIRRIARVLLFNNKGEVYLQLRSLDKEIAPNTWDQSAGGHVEEEEDYADAARRELFEELGISVVVLHEVTRFYMEEKATDNNLYQFNALFKSVYNKPINKLQKSEVENGRWFSIKDIKMNLKKNPGIFAPGFLRSWIEYQTVTNSAK